MVTFGFDDERWMLTSESGKHWQTGIAAQRDESSRRRALMGSLPTGCQPGHTSICGLDLARTSRQSRPSRRNFSSSGRQALSYGLVSCVTRRVTYD